MFPNFEKNQVTMSINWLQRWDAQTSTTIPVKGLESSSGDEELIGNLASFCGISMAEAGILSALCAIRQRKGDLYLNAFAEEADLDMDPKALQTGMEGLLEKGYIQIFPAVTLDRPDSICMSASAELALKFNQKSCLPKPPADPLQQKILQVYVKSISLRNQLLTLEEWTDFISEFLAKTDVPAFKSLKRKELTVADKSLAAFLAVLDLVESQGYPLKILARIFTHHPMEITNLRRAILEETHPLFKLGLLECEMLPSSDYLIRFGNTKRSSSHEPYMPMEFNDAPKLPLLTLPHDKLNGKKIHLNPAADQTLSDLKRLTRKAAFQRFQKQMKAAGEPEGLIVLLHGEPGTGKTESVKQWAKECKRDILMFDVAQQRDKWYGQSEKNLDLVFKHYKDSYQEKELAPILLFNEADSVFQKRDQTNGSMTSTENAMQTILLQHLEQFKGILVATTNLPNAFDPAFDRRFLYKIELGIPEPQIRKKILQDFFPGCSAQQYLELAENHVFTGAEVANFKKQCLIQQVLNPKKIFSLNEFKVFLEARTKILGTKSSVGFRRN